MSLKLSLASALILSLPACIQTAAAAEGRALRQGRVAEPGQYAQVDMQTVAEQIRRTLDRQTGDKPFVVDDRPGEVAQVQPQPDASQSDAASDAEPVEPDLSALRYFAQRGDTARLNAEIARLRSLYPNWKPPEDPLAAQPSVDTKLDAMWKLYSEGKLAELRTAIAERQKSEVGWQPPRDLMQRLEVAETRRQLVNASDLEQYDTVIRLAAATPSLLNCADVDVMWRVAEAFAKTDRSRRAMDAYGYVLKNCEDPQQRIATIQKAAPLLTYGNMQTLLAFEKTTDGKPEFDSIRNELARRFVADATAHPELSIAPDYLQRLQTLARSKGDAADDLLFGWYAIGRKQMSEAENWFRAARAKSDSASASQGLALALLARNAAAEAEEVMWRWREETPDASATYLAATANLLNGNPPPVLSEAVLLRVASFVVEKRYVPSAQQLGWYALAYDQPRTAEQWFRLALTWKADDEPSAYGLTLTLMQLNDKAGVAALQFAWSRRSPRIANLGLVDIPAGRQSVQAQAAGKPTVTRQPVASEERATRTADRRATAVPSRRRGGCNGDANSATLSAAQSLANGWCLMDLNRPLEAAKAFEAALQTRDARTREDAAYGQSLAYLRLGLTNQAAVAAANAPQRAARTTELQTAILANRAISAFDSKQYRQALVFLDQRKMIAAEPADLMILRGYALANLGRTGEAKRLFEVVAETGNRDAMRAVAEIRDQLKQPF